MGVNDVPKRATSILGCVRPSIANQLKGVMVPRLGGPHLECCGHIGAPQSKKDIKLLERVQRRATAMVRGVEGL